MQAVGGWIYILIGIFALLYNLYKAAGQQKKPQHKPQQPMPQQEPGQKDFRQLLDDIVLSNTGHTKRNAPKPKAEPVFYHTMEDEKPEEADDDSETQIVSELQQYQSLIGQRKQPLSVQHPPFEMSGNPAFPSDINSSSSDVNTTSLPTDGFDAGKAIIYGEILARPKWLEA